MAALAEEMCESTLPSYRTFDADTCLTEVADCTAAFESVLTTPGAFSLCTSMCAATVALCSGTDKCTDAQTWCPKILCKMGIHDSCPPAPGVAYDWCDWGTGLGGVDVYKNTADPQNLLGSVKCDNSQKSFSLYKDVGFGDRLLWKCSGTNTAYEAASNPVQSNVTLQAHKDKKQWGWYAKDTCRLVWSWD